ncbi:MAG: transmembrane protein 254 [Acidimicrobiales bacterium]|jgi:hypothetical protein|nr:transmembrane protein 254 [Acidimicrobiales bacterium]
MASTTPTASVPEPIAADTFARPHWLWLATVQPALALLGACALSGRADAALRDAGLPLPGRRVLQAAFWGTVVVHAGEAVAAHRWAGRAGLSRSAGRWAAQTFFMGFPSLLALRRTARA